MKLMCLNANDVTKPKAKPKPNEIIPSMMNYPTIINGVATVIFEVSMDLTVLYNMIETISLATPSPKQSVYSLGYCS